MDIVRSSLKIFIARLVNVVFGFVGLVFFARTLGSAPLGTFFVFQAVIAILTIPSDFGIRGAMEKRISEGEHPGQVLTTGLLLKLVPLTVIGVVIILTSSRLNAYIGTSLAKFIVLTLVLQEISQSLLGVLRGKLRVEETAPLVMLRQLVWVLAGGALVMLGYRVWSLVYAHMLAYIIRILWGAHLISFSLGAPSVNIGKSLIAYARYDVVARIGGNFFNWTDVLVIGFFLSQSHVGAYEVAWRLAMLVILFTRSIATAILPQISAWDSEGRTESIEPLLSQVLTTSMLVVVPAFFGTLILSTEIMELIFGTEFAIASTVAIILVGMQVIEGIRFLIDQALRGINKPDSSARALLVGAGCNLLLNVILVTSFGILGAAVATTIGATVTFALQYKSLSSYMNIIIKWKHISWSLIASVTMTSVLVIVQDFVTIKTVPVLFAAIGLGIVVYVSVIILNSALRAQIYRNVLKIISS